MSALFFLALDLEKVRTAIEGIMPLHIGCGPGLESAHLICAYPPFRNHCVREIFFEELFSEELREIVAIDCAI